LKAGRSEPLSPYQTPKITSSTSSKDEASLAKCEGEERTGTDVHESAKSKAQSSRDKAGKKNGGEGY